MNKKHSIAKIATVVWVIGFLLTSMMLSVPPANVPLYIGLACIAIIPLVLGSWPYRIFGVVALAFSLWAAIGEQNAGIKHQEKMRLLRERIEKKFGNTNLPPASQNTTTTNR